jgi:chromosome segregation ATPase
LQQISSEKETLLLQNSTLSADVQKTQSNLSDLVKKFETLTSDFEALVNQFFMFLLLQFSNSIFVSLLQKQNTQKQTYEQEIINWKSQFEQLETKEKFAKDEVEKLSQTVVDLKQQHETAVQQMEEFHKNQV